MATEQTDTSILENIKVWAETLLTIRGEGLDGPPVEITEKRKGELLVWDCLLSLLEERSTYWKDNFGERVQKDPRFAAALQRMRDKRAIEKAERKK